MKRFLCAVVLSLVVVGCGKPVAHIPKNQELRFNLKSEPPTLDPSKAMDVTSISVIELCFEGLMRLGEGDHPVFAVADSVQVSEDQLQYVFTLKKAEWSDGHPVRASDFEVHWKKILSPHFPCEFAHDLFLLKNARDAKMGKCSLDQIGVRALDDHTLVIDLEHPTPYLLSALASHSFLPIPTHVVQENANWMDVAYIGNGPFQLEQPKSHDKIVLIKNPHYWDQENVRLERIFFAYIQEELTELAMFENGELDWAGYPLSNLPTEALPSLIEEKKVESYDIAGTYCYVFNTTQYPFQNANIRKALALAINRSEIVKNVTLLNQKIATSLTPPVLKKSPLSYFQDEDLTEAKRLFEIGLKELGITKEQFPTLHLSYNTISGHHKIAQAIQQQWKTVLGISVSLENKEWKVFLDELVLGQFHVARMGGIASVEDPSTFLDDYRYLNRKNISQWHNPEYTALLEKADYCVDLEQREVLMNQAEKILLDEMPIAPIFFYRGVYMKQPYVKGVRISKLNHIDLKHAYVEVND